jgi:hypothetical protein
MALLSFVHGSIKYGFLIIHVCQSSKHPLPTITPDNWEYTVFVFSGSRKLFAALLECCVARKVVPICSFTPRTNAVPSLVALLPQEEKLDDSNIQILPPGFHVIYLPYAGKYFMFSPLSCVINLYPVRVEVLTAVLLRTQVFWDVMLCHWANSSHCFKGLQCVYCSGEIGRKRWWHCGPLKRQ